MMQTLAAFILHSMSQQIANIRKDRGYWLYSYTKAPCGFGVKNIIMESVLWRGQSKCHVRKSCNIVKNYSVPVHSSALPKTASQYPAVPCIIGPPQAPAEIHPLLNSFKHFPFEEGGRKISSAVLMLPKPRCASRGSRGWQRMSMIT